MSAAQKVDVLAYHARGMRNAAEAGGIKLTKAGCENLAQELESVRAAVAELIEAAQIALNYLPQNGVSRERLAAALARIGGDQS